MSTRIVLGIEAGLTPEEAEFVKQLLRDAIGEFITARSGRGSDRRTDYSPDPNDATIEYVRKRYPDLSVDAHLRKVDEVRLRKAIARKLRRAVDSVTIEDLPPSVPIAERTCEVLPTVFAESVEDEAKRLGEAMRDAERDKTSPVVAYSKADPDRDALLREMAGTDFEYDVERFSKK